VRLVSLRLLHCSFNNLIFSSTTYDNRPKSSRREPLRMVIGEIRLEKYYLFTDESYITNSRFRSIAAISVPYESYQILFPKLNQILTESEVKEFKWKNLNSAKSLYCAKKIIELVFTYLFPLNIRLDVIIWDTYDSRHEIQGRNDIANYERMFFHLVKNTMNKRNINSEWFIFPDQRNGIDWGTIQECLSNVGKKHIPENTIFGDYLISKNCSIKHFSTDTDSKKEPFVQVADFFAGLAVFSGAKYETYLSWKRSQDKNYTLFEEEDVEYTNSERYRCQILDLFLEKSQNKLLGVSLKSKKRLHTFKNSSSLNFWNYSPQGEYDKAPSNAHTN